MPHALALARRIVARLLNRRPSAAWRCAERAAALDPAEELYGIVPADLRQPFDVREIIARLGRRHASSMNSSRATAARS